MSEPDLPLTSASGRKQLLTGYRRGLLEDTIPFWFPHSLDREHGGFLHCLDREGTIVDTDKSVWIQGRMTWTLLTLYNTVEKRPEWLEGAKGGLNFLERHCFDADGHMFFHVTREGHPIRKRRYAYSESFAAIAHAAFAQATGEDKSATRARELFERFARWNFEPGVMPAKFSNERPMLSMGPRIIAVVTAQELRANLGADARLTGWIDRCIEEIEKLFVKTDLRAVMENVGPNGEIVDHFDGRLLNPGHAIEGAWFIMQEGKIRNDQHLVRLGRDMLDWMWERGWDHEFGGLFYFRDIYEKPVQEYWHDMKFWWPHDEAIIATLLAYELTGDPKYARWHQRVHDWAHQHFGDPQFGEWFGYLHRDGRLSVPLKGNLWKGAFHHPRMQWFCAQALAESETRASDHALS